MTHSSVAPGAFRWRLTVAFISVAAISAGVVASGSYLLVRNERTNNFLLRSMREARFVDEVARSRLSDRSDRDLSSVLTHLGRRYGFESLVVTEEHAYSPTSTLDEAGVPARYRDPSAVLGLDAERIDIEGRTFFVVPAEAPVDDAAVVFLFPMEHLFGSFDRLAGILWRLWVLVVVVAALVGSLLARRTLRPVARASRAARALAEGLLDTRLPVERQDEFGAWALSFNKMADALQQQIRELEEARERERRFTSDVSHELRTPLTALVTSASMVEEHIDRLPEDVRWPLEQLVGQIRRVRRLLEELMEISRLDAGREDVIQEDTEIFSFVRATLVQHGWDDGITLSGSSVVTSVDRLRLERILTNLVQNALEHGGEPIALDVSTRDSEIVVAVSDGGKGVDPEEVTRIFDRFYKGDPARGGGSGLGLSIALQNARLLGGDIRVRSEARGGATFTLALPLRRSST